MVASAGGAFSADASLSSSVICARMVPTQSRMMKLQMIKTGMSTHSRKNGRLLKRLRKDAPKLPSCEYQTTLPTRSLLLSWQLPYAVSDPAPQRGEIVTFWSDEMGKLLVKRVIGLPGDTVSFQDGYVYVNGEELDESYLPRQGISTSGSRREYAVPEGHLFFLGDNRTGSWDARSWDDPFIPVENVRSHVLVCISFLKGNSWLGIRAVA